MPQYLSGMPMIDEDMRRWWLVENFSTAPRVRRGALWSFGVKVRGPQTASLATPVLGRSVISANLLGNSSMPAGLPAGFLLVDEGIA